MKKNTTTLKILAAAAARPRPGRLQHDLQGDRVEQHHHHPEHHRHEHGRRDRGLPPVRRPRPATAWSG
ncbi:MAG: hypothetical protein MZU95_07070 [Desulfomicrobium escambiense]|nr:hypothetical protein [Desulfomicrobium escambiense]